MLSRFTKELAPWGRSNSSAYSCFRGEEVGGELVKVCRMNVVEARGQRHAAIVKADWSFKENVSNVQQQPGPWCSWARLSTRLWPWILGGEN